MAFPHDPFDHDFGKQMMRGHHARMRDLDRQIRRKRRNTAIASLFLIATMFGAVLLIIFLIISGRDDSSHPHEITADPTYEQRIKIKPEAHEPTGKIIIDNNPPVEREIEGRPGTKSFRDSW